MSAGFMEPVLGCIVAGGQSSRMGRDKASLVLNGESLLTCATRALEGVCSSVVVSGGAREIASALPVIPDATPGCGPLGGVVAALHFAEERSFSWVMFLPVDMPLLPMSLLPVLLREWSTAVGRGARICCAETDGIVQPLISLLHVRSASVLEERLAAGDLRVRPGMQLAAERLASEQGDPREAAFARTAICGDHRNGMHPAGWLPTTTEWMFRPHWFLNVNTPEQLALAEQAFDARRSMASSREMAE